MAKRSSQLKPVAVVDGRLACPSCGGMDFEYMEEVTSIHEVWHIGGNLITISADGVIPTDDKGINGRLFCCGCESVVALPHGYAIERPDPFVPWRSPAAKAGTV